MVQSVSGGCKLDSKFAVQSNTPFVAHPLWAQPLIPLATQSFEFLL